VESGERRANALPELNASMVPEVSIDEPRVERRQAPRRRVLKAGIVAFNDRFVSVQCTVRDISATGARLRVSGSISAPDKFELIIDIDGMEAHCEVVSRKANEIAVRFVSPPRMLPPKRAQVVMALVPSTPPTLRRKPKPAEAC
jgi:PilZ domain